MKGQDQCYPLFCGALDRGWPHDRLCLAYEVATIFSTMAPLQRTRSDGQAFKPAREAGVLPNQ
jgi:hypothetical protein